MECIDFKTYRMAIRFNIEAAFDLSRMQSPTEELLIRLKMTRLDKFGLGPDGWIAWVFRGGASIPSVSIWEEKMGGPGHFRASRFFVFGHRKLMQAAAQNISNMLSAGEPVV